MESVAAIQAAVNESVGPANRADFRISIEGLEDVELRVVELEGDEGISELFWFRVCVTVDEELASPELLPGRACTLKIVGSPDMWGPMERLVQGIVQRIERIREGVRQVSYAVDVVPQHWLLTQRRQSRIFQEQNCPDMSVAGIIEKVFRDAGLPESSFRFALHEQHAPREYVVQYRESDWSFVARLMEAEGIIFFFEHHDDGLQIVLGDGRASLLNNPRESHFRFRATTGLTPEAEHIYSVSERHEIRAGRVTLDDFDFKRPPFELRSSASAERETALELSDYPGEYTERDAGQRYARVRLEEQQWPRRVMQMQATVRVLLAGRLFLLLEHPSEPLNIDYLLLRVHHHATQSPGARAEDGGQVQLEYRAKALVLPADVPYRPACTTPRPFVHGSQTAIVVGPRAEEIYVDEYGRVKVQFHWDRQGEFNEHSSCWIRVSQGMAGGQYGMMFLPRVGQEVIVDFLEGNPDRPIITGRVYNNDHMPPYALPDAKSISAIRTCSTPGAKGGNEIRFDDAKGQEQLLLFAQKDLHFRARASRFENTCGSRHATVAHDEYESVKQNKHSNVGLDRLETIGGNKQLVVRGDIREECSGSRKSAFVGGVTLSAAEFRVESSTITLVCGGNFIKIDQDGIKIVGSMVDINSGGSAGPNAEFPPLKEQKEPSPAATTESGHNTRYDAAPDELNPLAPHGPPNPSDESPEQTEVSWIEIEQIDEAGRPCAGQRYEIKQPDGKVRHGRLDQQGLAHVAVRNPGLCEITFPDLDSAAWERIG